MKKKKKQPKFEIGERLVSINGQLLHGHLAVLDNNPSGYDGDAYLVRGDGEGYTFGTWLMKAEYVEKNFVTREEFEKMKIVKTVDAHTSFFLSKKEWEKIGEKAGWILTGEETIYFGKESKKKVDKGEVIEVFDE